MDIGPLRTLATTAIFGVLGVPATIVRIGQSEPASTVTTAIWSTFTTDDGLGTGLDLHRREPRRILGIQRSVVDALPRGSQIQAPLQSGGTVQRWRVDGVERVEPHLTRYLVIPDPDPLTQAPEI